MITLIVAILILCSYVLCKYEYFTSCTVQILIFCEFSPIILMCVFHVAILLAFLSCTLYIATWLHPNLMLWISVKLLVIIRYHCDIIWHDIM